MTVGALIVVGCSPDDQTATTTTRTQTNSSTRPTTPPSTTPPPGFITRDIVEANGIITCSSPDLVSVAERGYTRGEIKATFEGFNTSLANPAPGSQVFISFARLRSSDYIELALVDPGLIALLFDTYQIPGSLDMYCLQATPSLVEETSLLRARLREDGARIQPRNSIVRDDGRVAMTATSTGGWLDLTQLRLTAPPGDLLDLLRSLARTDDFAILSSPLARGAA